jgi:hypothetical protein
METTSEMKNAEPSQYQYISPKEEERERGERLRRKGVMKEMCVNFLSNCGADSAKD